MADVVRLSSGWSLAAQRAEALLGHSPIFTFQPDPADGATCCSIRLLRGEGEAWLGLVRDHSLFAERVRIGMRPRFVVHHHGETPVVCGDAEVRFRGRLPLEGESSREREALDALLEGQPFGHDELVVVEVRLSAVQVDDGEAPVHGAIPRT